MPGRWFGFLRTSGIKQHIIYVHRHEIEACGLERKVRMRLRANCSIDFCKGNPALSYDVRIERGNLVAQIDQWTSQLQK
jgi:hypothetical protein